MSIIKAEPVDPYLSVAIATGRPKLEVLVDDETVVKTDPDSVYYNGPLVEEIASVKEECSLNDDPVFLFVVFFMRNIFTSDINTHAQEVPTTNNRRKRRRANDAEVACASGEVSSADLSNV